LCNQSLKSVNNYVFNENISFFVSLTDAPGALVNKTRFFLWTGIYIEIFDFWGVYIAKFIKRPEILT